MTNQIRIPRHPVPSPSYRALRATLALPSDSLFEIHLFRYRFDRSTPIANEIWSACPRAVPSPHPAPPGTPRGGRPDRRRPRGQPPATGPRGATAGDCLSLTLRPFILVLSLHNYVVVSGPPSTRRSPTPPKRSSGVSSCTEGRSSTTATSAPTPLAAASSATRSRAWSTCPSAPR